MTTREKNRIQTARNTVSYSNDEQCRTGTTSDDNNKQCSRVTKSILTEVRSITTSHGRSGRQRMSDDDIEI